MKIPAVPGASVVYFYGGLALVAGVALIWIMNGGARTLTRAAASVPGEAIAGLTEGIGDSLGVPRTDAEKCAQAQRDGRLFDASLYCPAGTFIRGIFGSPGNEQAKPINRAGESSGVDTYFGL